MDETIETTYRPSRLEADWLRDSFGDWLEDGTLADVLYAVRGGKEANVYCCRAGPALGGGLVAAKVYRPRRFRELSNDAIYREGRAVLDAAGNARKGRDRRIRRAIERGTRAGKRAAHTSWVMHEWKALTEAHAAGARVPRPLDVSPNAILMDFVGDLDGAAPTLDRLRLAPEEAARALDEVLDTARILLALGQVHGDLSPFNVLWWEDHPTVIDLPQVADVLRNPHGPRLFLRDVERMCARLDPARDPRRVADAIWDEVFGTDRGVPDEVVSHAPPFDRSRHLRRAARSHYATIEPLPEDE